MNRREINYRNITLDGHNALRVEKVISEYELVPKKRNESDGNAPARVLKDKEEKFIKRLLNEEIKPIAFPLIQVTADQIEQCRKKGISSFVYKQN